MKYVKVHAEASENGDVKPPSASDWSKRHPALWEYLTLTKFANGTKRKTSTLLVFVEEGQVKACLNDRHGLASAWASGSSVETVLASLEAGLSTDEIEWRRKAGRRAG